MRMPKFIVWGFQNGSDFNHPAIVAVCKTRDQAIEVVTTKMKEESGQGDRLLTTRWFRVVPSDVSMPGFE
jgi:hypothetical protein